MGSRQKSRGGSEAKFCTKMILALFFFCFCGIVSCSPVSEVEDRGLVGDIAMGILVGKIPDPSLMALLVYLAQQLQPPPHQRRKRNLVFSKPCFRCSSLLPTPPPPPQHQLPPSVVVFLEVASLVVPAMTRPQPPPQPLQPPPPPSVEVFWEAVFLAVQAMTRLQPPPPQQQPPQLQPQPPPNVEVFLEGDFFVRNTTFLFRTKYLLDTK